MKTKKTYIATLVCLLLGGVFYVALAFAGDDNFEVAKQEILLREIGHRVLLQSGDSTSRVLPVQKIGEHEYQIGFENPLTFNPDSLLAIVNKAMAANKLAHNYIVNVIKCADKSVIFGYAMLTEKDKPHNIVPCSGRKQVKNCYAINIKFQTGGISATQRKYLLGGLPLLAFVGLLLVRSGVNSRKKHPALSGGNKAANLAIGNTIFNIESKQLIFADTITELTPKESQILLLFALSPNMVIERAQLQKRIWEDEGVIVGRSLDMFISKLRKKLERDSAVKLLNIHGKGYKLAVA